MTAEAPIVVGIDGGEASLAALEFALREAHLRRTHVRAVSCWPSTDRRDDSGPLLCETQEEAAELLEHVIERARLRNPDASTVVREVENNLAGPALVTASRHAQLVVLGSTTRGTYGHHHGRKTIEHCLLFAECPIVIVPYTTARLDEVDIDIDLHLDITR